MATLDSEPGVARAMLGLNTFAQLLSCVDPVRWESLGRPSAEGLAVIQSTLVRELAAEVGESRAA